MPHYLQTNKTGYVIGVTRKPDPIKLLDGDSQIYREIADEQTRPAVLLLEERHSVGEGLHINELENILSQEKK